MPMDTVHFTRYKQAEGGERTQTLSQYEFEPKSKF